MTYKKKASIRRGKVLRKAIYMLSGRLRKTAEKF